MFAFRREITTVALLRRHRRTREARYDRPRLSLMSDAGRRRGTRRARCGRRRANRGTGRIMFRGRLGGAVDGAAAASNLMSVGPVKIRSFLIAARLPHLPAYLFMHECPDGAVTVDTSGVLAVPSIPVCCVAALLRVYSRGFELFRIVPSLGHSRLPPRIGRPLAAVFNHT